jgi:acyl-CoA synthetase (AMP-forming)/AMP-acid ligase II
MSGITVIIGHQFSTRNFWREVRDNKATIVQYVGETMRYLLAAPSEIDSATGEQLDRKHDVRLAFGNGLRPEIWNRVKERFGIETIGEFYSSTEGPSGSWNLSSNDFSAGAVGRNGYLTQLLYSKTSVIVEFDHEKGVPWRNVHTNFCKEVPRGDVGELLYALDADKINSSFQGYLENRKATEDKVIRNVLRKGDAWFRTGDLMRWDRDGLWHFSDRIGDTFRWKSENVSTSEVATILGAHPEILEANVYGVSLPHHDGRAGCAAIILRRDGHEQEANPLTIPEPSPEVLKSVAMHTRKNLPSFAVPLFLRVIPTMQATGNNKQQKHALREEGVDPIRMASTDRLYWHRQGQYVPFRTDDWKRLNAGNVKL